jgi:hypothetical protein
MQYMRFSTSSQSEMTAAPSDSPIPSSLTEPMTMWHFLSILLNSKILPKISMQEMLLYLNEIMFKRGLLGYTEINTEGLTALLERVEEIGYHNTYWHTLHNPMGNHWPEPIVELPNAY